MRWLRRHDPQLLAVRRAARVTLVACLGFYVCRYLLDSAAMAPYALFGAVALGALSQIPGSPRRRARTLLTVLPVAWVLITLGTLLSVSTWAATAGMFLLGFVVSFVGVGGPRLVGLAAGMQLLYILPCFPPYDPGSLPERLAGITMALLLLAAAEVLLWPDPTPVPYRRKLADAVDALAGCLAAVADAWGGDPAGRERLAALLREAIDGAEALRPSRLPPIERPASAGRRDRTLSSAAGTARLLLGRAVDLFFADERDAVTLPAATHLVRRTAACTAAAAAWLRDDGPVPDTNMVVAALTEFRAARMNTDPNGLPPEWLRLGALALALGEWTKSLIFAVRIAAGERPGHPDPTSEAARPGPFWYAYEKTPWLWWHRLKENLTPRSVAFQGALRLAAALAVARLLAGVFRSVARLLGSADHPHRAAHVGRGDPVGAAARPGRHGGRLARRGGSAGRRDGSDRVRRRAAGGDAGRLRGRAAARAGLVAGPLHARDHAGVRPGHAGGLAAGRGAPAGRAGGRRDRGAGRAVRLAAWRWRGAAPVHRHLRDGGRGGDPGDRRGDGETCGPGWTACARTSPGSAACRNRGRTCDTG